jgi:hypothetical protein
MAETLETHLQKSAISTHVGFQTAAAETPAQKPQYYHV